MVKQRVRPGKGAVVVTILYLDRAPHRRRFKPTADGWQAAKILIQDQHRFADVRGSTLVAQSRVNFRRQVVNRPL